jgi:alpha-L-rhamnosidase
MENNLRYLDYAALYENEDGLVKFGLGDWCPPKHVEGLKLASNELSDSCYYYTNLRITAEALLRRSDKRSAQILARADRLYKAILKKYLVNGIVDNDSISAISIFLYHLPIEETVGRKLADHLADKIEEADYRVLCGILGVKAMFEVLDKYGHSRTAYRIMLCNEYPSFGVWQNEGLLTLPESLDMDAVAGLSSLNHHMYSSPVNWIYRRVGGIRNEGVAYDVCRIEPYIFADNSSAECFTETPRGKISVKWSCSDGEFSADIHIPDGTVATLSVLGKETALKVGSNKVKLKV